MAMEDPFGWTIEAIKEELENNGPAAGAEKVQEYLKAQNNIPLKIGITGESGSGKSTFVNAFRGVEDSDEGAALTDCVEATMEVTSYPHPIYPNVTLWDLPGVGTTKFPADKYLKYVGFEKFDFFIIISDTRFRENDVKLAQEIQKMGKKFYFVRSKIDQDLCNEKRKRNFNEEKTLEKIRKNCNQGLQEKGFEAPQVFLVSSYNLHLYDFHLLEETLEGELPAHKKSVLLFAMPNVSLEIINKKKEAFHVNIKYHAIASAVGAAAPVPGLSFAVDTTMIVGVVSQYIAGFGLDMLSLEKLAKSTNVPLSDLIAVIVSPLAAVEITAELVIKLLMQCYTTAALAAAEEVSRLIPIFGIPAAMGLSFCSTYRALEFLLDIVAEDAQRVFKKALGLIS